MIRDSLIASTLVLAMTQMAHAEPVSLQDAVRNALQHSPSIASAEAGLEQGLAGMDAARAKQGFTVGVQGQVGVSHTDFTTSTVDQEPMQAGIQAEMPLWTSGANAAALSAAGLQSDAARNNLAAQREKVVLDTIEAFANAWLAERVLDVGQARVETLRIRLDETNSRFAQGLVTRTDTALTEARLASAEASQAANRAMHAVAVARLERVTGIKGIEPISPLAGPELDVPASYEDALAHMLETHPNLKAAQNMVDAADFRLKEAKGRFGPKVSVQARAFTGEDIYFFFPDQISEVGAFVSVEMPLYTSGLKAASTREALAGRSQASASYRDAELQLTEALAGAWGDMEARELALTAAKGAEEAAGLASEGARKEYDAGIRTLVDSLDAENEFRDAQIGRRRAETNLLIAKARVLSLLSELGAEVLN